MDFYSVYFKIKRVKHCCVNAAQPRRSVRKRVKFIPPAHGASFYFPGIFAHIAIVLRPGKHTITAAVIFAALFLNKSEHFHHRYQYTTVLPVWQILFILKPLLQPSRRESCRTHTRLHSCKAYRLTEQIRAFCRYPSTQCPLSHLLHSRKQCFRCIFPRR